MTMRVIEKSPRKAAPESDESVSAGAYRPGLATAPVLVAIALFLARELRHVPTATRAAA
jgi:hypothetical protein